MRIRDRIKELRRVPARELRPNPRNWRSHPLEQRDALRGLLAEIGFAGALLARELADGSLELIDGHLRAETTPDEMVPVLVLDVDEAEASKILATHDPLAAMAGVDIEQWSRLIADVEFDSPAVQKLLESVAAQAASSDPPAGAEDETCALAESYQLIVACADEQEQRRLLERLSREGFSCRALFT